MKFFTSLKYFTLFCLLCSQFKLEYAFSQNGSPPTDEDFKDWPRSYENTSLDDKFNEVASTLLKSTRGSYLFTLIRLEYELQIAINSLESVKESLQKVQKKQNRFWLYLPAAAVVAIPYVLAFRNNAACAKTNECLMAHIGSSQFLRGWAQTASGGAALAIFSTGVIQLGLTEAEKMDLEYEVEKVSRNLSKKQLELDAAKEKLVRIDAVNLSPSEAAAEAIKLNFLKQYYLSKTEEAVLNNFEKSLFNLNKETFAQDIVIKCSLAMVLWLKGLKTTDAYTFATLSGAAIVVTGDAAISIKLNMKQASALRDHIESAREILFKKKKDLLALIGEVKNH